MKKFGTQFDEQLDRLTGPGPAPSGDQWPTHRAKARAARLAYPLTTEDTDDE